MRETEFVSSFSDYGKTEPVGGMGAPSVTETSYGGWDPMQVGGGVPTAPLTGGSGFTAPPEEPFQPEGYGGTVAITPDDIEGFMPAVGWLVCTEGADRGRDYRLHVGYNRIGRNPGNDVCISGDAKISGERHAVVAFDQEEKIFFCAPGESINLVRLNNKVLMMPSPLKYGDILTVGQTKLMFIPLCGENFSW